MRTYLIICASLFTSTESGSDMEKNEFDIEFVKNFKGMVQISWTYFDQKYFSFNETELDDLCTKAQRFSHLDGSNPGAESYAPFYNRHQFVNRHYKRLPYVRCRTIPTSYLCLRLTDSNPKNAIVMQMNQFMTDLSNRFQVRTIKSEPIGLSSAKTIENTLENLVSAKPQEFESSYDDENFQLLSSYLFQLSDTDRLHLCFAAREAIRLDNAYPQNVPKLLSENMKKVEIFDVQFTVTEKQKYVLLQCHSSPSMYVGQQMEENLQSSNFMEVLLVPNDERI